MPITATHSGNGAHFRLRSISSVRALRAHCPCALQVTSQLCVCVCWRAAGGKQVDTNSEFQYNRIARQTGPPSSSFNRRAAAAAAAAVKFYCSFENAHAPVADSRAIKPRVRDKGWLENQSTWTIITVEVIIVFKCAAVLTLAASARGGRRLFICAPRTRLVCCDGVGGGGSRCRTDGNCRADRSVDGLRNTIERALVTLIAARAPLLLRPAGSLRLYQQSNADRRRRRRRIEETKLQR